MERVKDDKYYIEKVISNINFILSHVENKSINDLEKDEVLLDSVLFRLVQVAEYSQEISPKLKDATENLPWHELYGIRNRIVHAYDFVKIDIVYNTVKNDLKPFRDSLLSIIENI